MSAPRHGEIFVERFVVALHKHGGGYLSHMTRGRPYFTPDLRKALRFESKAEMKRKIEAHDLEPVAWVRITCTAEIRIGPKPKPPPAPTPAPAKGKKKPQQGAKPDGEAEPGSPQLALGG